MATSALFEPIAHPVLRSFDPARVSKFLKEYARYRAEVQERQKEVPSMSVASFKVCIERSRLDHMHFIGKFDDIAPGKAVDELTSDHIETFIRSIVTHEEGKEINPRVLEKALKGIQMPMEIADPGARVMEFVSDFFERLDAVGYGDFKVKNPKKTVKLLQERLYPPGLKDAMLQHLEYQPGLKGKLRDYIVLLEKEAVVHEKYRAGRGNSARGELQNNSGSRNTTRPSSGRRNSRNDGPSNGGGSNAQGNRQGRGGNGRSVPLCLNPKCAKEGKRHWVRDCEDTSDEYRKRLLKENAEKKGKMARLARRPGGSEAKDNSVVMSAVFGGAVTASVCADGGSDVNLMSPDLFARLVEGRVDMEVRRFNSPQSLRLVAKNATIEYDRELKITTELLIRHGTSLKLRNSRWLVAKEDIDGPLLGRPTLEALGLDTKKLLAEAADKYGGEIDLAGLVPDETHPEGSVARILSSGVYHSDHAEHGEYEDGAEDDQVADLGVDTEVEVEAALGGLLDKAASEGISDQGKVRLREMLKKYRDVFRVRLGPGPPADVEPMHLTLKPNAVPHIAKPRRYTPDQKRFMEGYVQRLDEFGFMAANKNATWAAAPVLAPKPPPANFRLTFDLKRVNQSTEPVVWSMPHIESEVTGLSGSTCYASIDFCSAYWQMPVDEATAVLQSVWTPRGIYKSYRTLQGIHNSAPNFQSKVEPCFSIISDNTIFWLDDALIHAPTELELLNVLERFLIICRERNLKVSAKKSTLFNAKIRWCGRVISKDGTTCDPRRLEGLKECHPPEKAHELSQFIHCVQWMSRYIPDFPGRVAPLRDILEKAYAQSGKRTTRSIKNVSLSQLSWGPEHLKAFNDLQEQLRSAVRLSHRKRDMTLCIFTDASDKRWAAVVTQTNARELEKPTMEQCHEPLAFLGAQFNSAQLRWSTFEKEGFAIYETFRKMDYLLAGEHNTHVFTDHRNLMFVFNPAAFCPSVGHHVVNKVIRWALYLSQFIYRIEHVPGDTNVMADIMSRWLGGYRSGRTSNCARVRRLIAHRDLPDLVKSPEDDDYDWPSEEDIKESQGKFVHERPAGCKCKGDIWMDRNKVWIPNSATELHIRLLVAAHCGASGHRGAETTSSRLKERYTWATLEEDTREFVRNCLHCIVAKGGIKVPRPLSSALHGTRPNEVLHFDYIYMGLGIDELKYVLVLQDDLSSYKWFCATSAAAAEPAAEEIARWIRVFSPMEWWVSDQGTHFKCRLMEALAEHHMIKHNFTVAHSPWVNGTVESAMRHLRAACTALLSEYRLGPGDWPLVIDTVMRALNEAPLKRLGSRSDGTFRCPLEVMTGIRPRRQEFKFELAGNDDTRIFSVGRARTMQVIEIERLQSALDNMHKDVAQRVARNRKKHIDEHNRKTNLILPDFKLGDFVLVRKAGKVGHKMSFRWVGPRRVVRALGELVYEVEDLLKGERTTVHAARLLPYRAALRGEEVSPELRNQAEHMEAKFEVVEELVDIAEGDRGIFIQVKWLGLPDKCDWTWQSLQELYEDIPDRLHQYLQGGRRKKKLKKKALDQLAASNTSA